MNIQEAFKQLVMENQLIRRARWQGNPDRKDIYIMYDRDTDVFCAMHAAYEPFKDITFELSLDDIIADDWVCGVNMV